MAAKAKTALITGITGQDGSYLAEFLLERGYCVHGISRQAPTAVADRVDRLHTCHRSSRYDVRLHFGDLADAQGLLRIVRDVEPDEVYNLAAQSHVGISFAKPEETENINGRGTLRLLEAIRSLKLDQTTKFYQASSPELYDPASKPPQNESTAFRPQSPYGMAKLFAHQATVYYREVHGFYACNGILFNHESPLRDERFVTRKVTRALSLIKLGARSTLSLGNLNVGRDWGHARDYVRMQWQMLQQTVPSDFVIATGIQHTVRELVTLAASYLDMTIEWEGEGIEEKGREMGNGRIIVEVDPRLFRLTEMQNLIGDSSRACSVLGWEPKVSFSDLVGEMVREDFDRAKGELAGGT